MTIHLRGAVLPEGHVRDLWIDGDRLSYQPLPSARTLSDHGYLVPGLVDAHCHPGTVAIGEPLHVAQLTTDGASHLQSGTALVRVPGSASRLPPWFGQRPSTPRVTHAGLPVAVERGFFPGWGRQVPPERVSDAAVEEAADTGWCKLIIDWMTDDGDYAMTMSPSVVADATDAVHTAGGKVAVHTQSAEGGHSAVAAGVDSLEHGMHLPLDDVDALAAQGTVLVPTASSFMAMTPQMQSDDVPDALRRWYTTGLRHHPELVRAAYRAGVRILAGTDLPPGSLTKEIRWLNRAGLSPHDALGAGSWDARDWLGYPGIAPEAPADIVVYADDPRRDLDMLDQPAHIIVRGRVLK